MGVFLLLLSFSAEVSSQNKEGYNWIFGIKAGMTWMNTQSQTNVPALNASGNPSGITKDFSNLPTPLSGSVINQLEGVFCMSDAQGELLFYSDGMKIWNKNHQETATGLTGGTSSSQSGIIIPHPGINNTYIAFTIAQQGNSNLSYSIVDRFGVVAAGNKNILMTGGKGNLNEQVAAIKKTNGNGYWIVAAGEGVGTNSSLNVWEVNASGVNTVCIGSYPLTVNTVPSDIGYLRFSPDGKYFAWPMYTSNHLVFGTFDPNNGIITNLKVFTPPYHYAYGAEFSISGDILYIAEIQYANSRLFAYKFADLLAATNYNAVPNRTINFNQNIGALQLAPDGRIYGVLWDVSEMMIIDDVNDFDNFTVHKVSGLLPPSSRGQVGLPNFPAHFFAPVHATNCRGDTATITASLDSVGSITNPIYKWYDAPTGGTLLFTGPVFTTSTVLMADTVFYVSVEGDNYCAGERLIVNVTVEDCASVVPDTATVIQNGQVLIDVKANDDLSKCPTVIPTPTTPTQGTAVAVGDKILYKPNTDFFGLDSLEYSVVCGGTTYTTKIYITVFKAPDMIKEAILLPGNTVLNGTYPNPVSILFRDTINYRITAANTGLPGGETLIITDTMPPYLNFIAGSDNPSASTSTTTIIPTRTVLKWTFPNVPVNNTRTVSFKATPQIGSVASQPLFINKAIVTIVRSPGDSTLVPTNGTFHQGAGISITTFSAGFGGHIYNAEEQALDYMTSPRSGIVIVPEEGYRFAGWSHSNYVSLKGALIEAQEGIMLYDTLTVYGNVELHANFKPEEYPIEYYLNGSENAKANPGKYTVKSGTIKLEAPLKQGDVFIGWTSPNSEDVQENVVITNGSTGGLTFYANFLHSGREEDVKAKVSANEDKVWAVNDDLHVQTAKAGSIVRIYTTESILRQQRTIVSAGTTLIKLKRGIYIVTINNGTGKKIIIE